MRAQGEEEREGDGLGLEGQACEEGRGVSALQRGLGVGIRGAGGVGWGGERGRREALGVRVEVRLGLG